MGARVTFTWLKDTLVGCGTAAEVSDLNSLSCGNSVPNPILKTGLLSRPFLSCDCHVLDYQINQQRLGIMMIYCMCV